MHERPSLRTVHIGFAVGMAILVVGTILFADAKHGVPDLLVVVSFLAAFVVHHALDERQRRRDRRRGEQR